MVRLADPPGGPLAKRHSETLAAACWGHLDALKQWKEQSGKQKGLFFEKNIGYFAASGGRLEVLKYAHGNELPWTCEAAARGGHLDVLKYAHEKGCPWNEWTCQYAADSLHFEVLKYARDTD